MHPGRPNPQVPGRGRGARRRLQLLRLEDCEHGAGRSLVYVMTAAALALHETQDSLHPCRPHSCRLHSLLSIFCSLLVNFLHCLVSPVLRRGRAGVGGKLYIRLHRRLRCGCCIQCPPDRGSATAAGRRDCAVRGKAGGFRGDGRLYGGSGLHTGLRSRWAALLSVASVTPCSLRAALSLPFCSPKHVMHAHCWLWPLIDFHS